MRIRKTWWVSPHPTECRMNLATEFAALLRCPEGCGPLDLRGDVLSCHVCRREYPIVNDIPRFVSQEHLASFGLQWYKYEVAHDDEDRATFQAKTGFSLNELRGLRVLDA